MSDQPMSLTLANERIHCGTDTFCAASNRRTIRTIQSMTTNNRTKSNVAKLLVINEQPEELTLMEKVVSYTFDQVQLIPFTASASALHYLENCLHMAAEVPHLILTDLFLPTREEGWKLVQQIRAYAPPVGLLPILMLGHSRDFQDINQSYSLGVNTYIIKPTTFDGWMGHFEVIKEYWMDTVSLPRVRYI